MKKYYITTEAGHNMWHYIGDPLNPTSTLDAGIVTATREEMRVDEFGTYVERKLNTPDIIEEALKNIVAYALGTPNWEADLDPVRESLTTIYQRGSKEGAKMVTDSFDIKLKNTHQQPNSKEWEKRVVELQFKTMLSRDMPEVAKKYHQEMIDFIQSLLTSHSEAIRERVMKLEYEENDADGNHSYDRARQKEGYYYAKDDILALLTDEV